LSAIHAIPGKAIQALIAFASTLSIDQRLHEFINLRISQINGCAFCIDMHAAALAKQGAPARHLHVLAGWREAHRFFSAPERAALTWVEAVNAIPERGPSDAEFHEMRKHFDDTQIAQIILAVGAIRAFNMMNVSMQTPVPETPFVKGE
jgi:AhpD family alkylhydroperoxidase